MIKIVYDDNDERLAQSKAQKMIENGLYSRFNLNQNDRLEKAFLGMLGEITFQKFLKIKQIPYDIDETDFNVSNSDEFDVKIKNALFDIKIAKTTNTPQDGWSYGYPEEQHPEKKDFIVVGCLNKQQRTVMFYGWISGKEVQKFPVVTINSFAKFPYKTPNHEFRYGNLNKDFDKLFKEVLANMP